MGVQTFVHLTLLRPVSSLANLVARAVRSRAHGCITSFQFKQKARQFHNNKDGVHKEANFVAFDSEKEKAEGT